MDVGAALIAFFLVPTAYYMHAFWKLDDPMMRAVQHAMFMKNIALAGAALIILFASIVLENGFDLVVGPVSLWNQLGY
jgi:uncharacterized membrane protein YphA (DoxX/SURF4 family)